ncbi:hypothetical protein MUN82_02390 [Hymenobacter aerilatus]|uniref:STAS/SEC14 domain-containing protein n=1 Tax=Hymenobacter aerilatus TaxID=2932251 RepID=A0A8T9SX52_9BACT|nr:hypothetical protein [Hymenobacter aerilatus]UOR05961.1 hypothetical protein MUN82_02390 [Hymenobacter aerilatus]
MCFDELEYVREVPGLIISYDRTNQWIYADWHGEHTPESSTVACQALLEVAQEKHYAKILNDNSNITHSTARITDVGWQWMRDIYAAGVLFFVWVSPTTAMDEQMRENALRSSGRPFVVTFPDLASACSWLLRQAVPND